MVRKFLYNKFNEYLYDKAIIKNRPKIRLLLLYLYQVSEPCQPLKYINLLTHYFYLTCKFEIAKDTKCLNKEFIYLHIIEFLQSI